MYFTTNDCGVVMRSIACVCVWYVCCVCLICSGFNFWKPWPTNFIFVRSYIFRTYRLKSSIKVRVIGAKLNTFADGLPSTGISDHFRSFFLIHSRLCFSNVVAEQIHIWIFTERCHTSVSPVPHVLKCGSINSVNFFMNTRKYNV